jgi:hypothetical protein
MLKPKYHRYFALFLIAAFLQAIAFSSFFSDVQSQPEPQPTPPTQTVGGGVRSPNSKCKIAKDNQTPDPVSLGEAKPFNTLPMRLQKIVAYSQSVGWVKADNIRKNVTDYKLARITDLKKAFKN